MENTVNRTYQIRHMLCFALIPLLIPGLFANSPEIEPLPSFVPPATIQQPLATFPDSFTMPDYLYIPRLLIDQGNIGNRPYYNFHPVGVNLFNGFSVCLYAVQKIDQYGQVKVYPTCAATKDHNLRKYPPLYYGDVFPMLDQLYYFESVDKLVKVLEVKGFLGQFSREKFSLKGQIILPLAPLDILPDADPLNPKIICRSPVVQIKKTPTGDLSAMIFTDHGVDGYPAPDLLGLSPDSFKSKNEYKVGDILINRDKVKNPKYQPNPAGYKITKIIPPDIDFGGNKRTFSTVEGEKTGRLIGWVELDPTPIPLDENGNPIKSQSD